MLFSSAPLALVDADKQHYNAVTVMPWPIIVGCDRELIHIEKRLWNGINVSKLVLLNRESLTVEFTSEASRPQIDDELVDNVVALANTEKTGRCTLTSKTAAR